MKRIYLDNAATTALHPEVRESMLRCMGEQFGNPASVHWFGMQAKALLEKAREQVADFLGAEPQEIIFTSSGTEANNTALAGTIRTSGANPSHLIVSAVEHLSVLECARRLGRHSVDVTEVGVDRFCRVDPAEVEAAIRPNTVLVSIMLANNQVGTLQPVRQIAALARSRGVTVHCDAVQAAGKMPLDVGELGVDMLTISAHKLYGPKGAAALYLRRGTPLEPLLSGGHQENNRRAGTVNLPAMVGFGEACRLAKLELAARQLHYEKLRQRLEQKTNNIAGLHLLGHPQERLPDIFTFYVERALGEMLVLGLDQHGVAVSAGSACTAGESAPSHVLLAMGLSEQQALGAVRISPGSFNTIEEIDLAAGALQKLLTTLH